MTKKMSAKDLLLAIRGKLLIIFISVILGVFLGIGISSNNHSLDETRVLMGIAKDAMHFRAKPERVAERIKTELSIPVDFSHGDTVIVLPDEIGFLDMGERKLIYMKLDKDGRCDQVWIEWQPVGYP
jgi:hypothetical protein